MKYFSVTIDQSIDKDFLIARVHFGEERLLCQRKSTKSYQKNFHV